MSPEDIKNIYELLASRVVPHSAREGAAIMALGSRLVSHFAQKPAAPQSSPQTAPAPTPT